MQHFRWRVVEGLKLALFLTVPASIGLCILAEPIIGLIFEHGRFLGDDVEATARLLQAFTIGLAGYACIKVLAPTFYALDLPRIPVMISARAIVLNLIFTSIFILVFDWGLVALPLSVSLVALLNLFQLAFALSKRLGSLTSGTDFPAFFLKMIILCSAIAALTWTMRFFLYPAEAGFMARLIFLGVTIPAVAGTYFGIARVLKIEEGAHLIETLSRKAANKSASE
jgi:putative peptidoglycan lipid II flippase